MSFRPLSTLARLASAILAGWLLSRVVAERRFQARLARSTAPWPDVPADPPVGAA